jgi:hypothetical protein
MSDKNIDAIKERLRVDLEKLKITVTIIVLLTGGLIGLLFKDIRLPLNIVLFIVGIVSEMICVWYLAVLNNSIKNLLEQMEATND